MKLDIEGSVAKTKIVEDLGAKAVQTFARPEAIAAGRTSLAPPVAKAIAAAADAAAERERAKLGKDAQRGRKVLEGAVAGGKGRKKLTAEQEAEAAQKRDRLIVRGHTTNAACQTVGDEYNVSYRTIARLKTHEK